MAGDEAPAATTGGANGKGSLTAWKAIQRQGAGSIFQGAVRPASLLRKSISD